VSRKKVFTVSVHVKGHRSKEIVPGRGGVVVGSGYDCDIISTQAGFSGKGFTILKRSGRDHLLRLPESVQDATVTVDGKSLSITALDELGLLKKKHGVFLIKIPAGKDCTAAIGNITLEMGMRAFAGEAVIGSAVPVDAALKRSWISRDDYSFFTVLIASALLHFALVAILDKIEIKKPPPAEAIRQMAPRFARLILESPAKKKVMAVRGGGPAAVKKKKTEPKPEKKVRKKSSGKKALKKAAVKKPVRRSVRKQGLVGVIMARSRPVVAIDEADDIIADIDKTGRDRQSSRAKGKEAISSVARSVAQTRLVSVDKVIKGSGSMGKNVGLLVGEQRESGTAGRSNFGTDGGTGRGVSSEMARNVSELRSRDEADVYKRVRSYIGGLKYIYNSALRKKQNLKGNVTVRFVITPEGRVKDVALVATTLASEEVVDRVIRKIYRWKFNKLRSGEDFVITYTFDFSPVG